MVLGPYSNGPVRFGETLSSPRVSRWVRDHPVSRLVQWDAGAYSSLSQVEDAANLRPIVSTDNAPLILAGQHEGVRVVQLTFDPLTSDLPLRISWPVFLFNSVGWLTSGEGVDAESQQAQSGRPVTLNLPLGADLDQVTASAPDGSPVATLIRTNRLSITQPNRTGIYTIQGATFSRKLALNLLSKRESNIAPQSKLPFGQAEPRLAQAGIITGQRELWRPLLMCVLAFMFLEWLLFHRRRSI